MKKRRINPFKNADDVYLTKNKIAVVKNKNTTTKRSHTHTETVKYYTRTDKNLAKLKQVTLSVRVGRHGSEYEKL
jgi:hypothetical protein